MLTLASGLLSVSEPVGLTVGCSELAVPSTSEEVPPVVGVMGMLGD